MTSHSDLAIHQMPLICARALPENAIAKDVSLVFPNMSSAITVGPLVGWMLALTVKHVIADFLLQNHWMAAGKDAKTGWALPLLTHCLIHGVLTTALVAAVAPRFWFIGPVDFVIHIIIEYDADIAKAKR